MNKYKMILLITIVSLFKINTKGKGVLKTKLTLLESD